MKKTVKISLSILASVAIALVGIKFIPTNETTDNKEVKVAEDTTAAIEKETEIETQKEITPEERKKILDEITAKPTEIISHPKKEEVKEKPEDMITVVPVKTTEKPIATSTKEPVKKEDTSKKVNTIVKLEPVKTTPVVTENKNTEDKKTETKPSSETKPTETKKTSLDDYRGELPDYGGDGPTPASELGNGLGGGTGISIDELNKNN